jgi:hypothetical protein
MKKLAACAVAALFGMSCAFAGEAVVTRTDEVRVDPEVKQRVEVAKQKTKRAAKMAKAKTKTAAKRTRAAAHRAAQRTEAAADHAADRVRAADSRTVVRVDTTVKSNRGEAVLERNASDARRGAEP